MKKRVTIAIDKNVDLQFRTLASQRLEFTTGWYSRAVEEAMKLWIEQEVKK